MGESIRQLLTGLRVLVALTVVLGIGYPLVMTGIARVGFDDQRNGSLVTSDGQVIGSALIGQQFEGDTWFIPRPSAGDYDALASAGSNDGPTSADLVTDINDRRTEIAERENVDPAAVPPDAVTASASGLDPFVSVAYARIQIPRVATARGLDQAVVTQLVEENTKGRMLGYLGMPRVNVLQLNLALSER